jgi:large subunit ribosomal protein L34
MQLEPPKEKKNDLLIDIIFISLSQRTLNLAPRSLFLAMLSALRFSSFAGPLLARAFHSPSSSTVSIASSPFQYQYSSQLRTCDSPFQIDSLPSQQLDLPPLIPMENNNTDIVGMFLLKRTYQPHVKKRKRTHGFLKRAQTPGGIAVLRRRLAKGRKYLAV